MVGRFTSESVLADQSDRELHDSSAVRRGHGGHQVDGEALPGAFLVRPFLHADPDAQCGPGPAGRVAVYADSVAGVTRTAQAGQSTVAVLPPATLVTWTGKSLRFSISMVRAWPVPEAVC